MNARQNIIIFINGEKLSFPYDNNSEKLKRIHELLYIQKDIPSCKAIQTTNGAIIRYKFKNGWVLEAINCVGSTDIAVSTIWLGSMLQNECLVWVLEKSKMLENKYEVDKIHSRVIVHTISDFFKLISIVKNIPGFEKLMHYMSEEEGNKDE